MIKVFKGYFKSKFCIKPHSFFTMFKVFKVSHVIIFIFAQCSKNSKYETSLFLHNVQSIQSTKPHSFCTSYSCWPPPAAVECQRLFPELQKIFKIQIYFNLQPEEKKLQKNSKSNMFQTPSRGVALRILPIAIHIILAMIASWKVWHPSTLTLFIESWYLYNIYLYIYSNIYRVVFFTGPLPKYRKVNLG